MLDGKDPASEFIVENCAFSAGFSKDACLRAWEKVGAAPCTMVCLDDAHVRRQLGDADDQENDAMRLIQDLNDYATTTLNMHGFNGDLLKAQIEKQTNSGPLTQPNTKDRVLLLAKAKRHGAKFTATGGDHLTSDDFFKSVVVPTREAEIKGMEAEKTKRSKDAKIEEETKEVLVSARHHSQYDVTMLNKLMLFYGHSKEGTKVQKVAKWETILNGRIEPPSRKKWEEENEKELAELKKWISNSKTLQ